MIINIDIEIEEKKEKKDLMIIPKNIYTGYGSIMTLVIWNKISFPKYRTIT